MTPRKTILEALSRARDLEGPGVFTRPSTITGFNDRPADFQKAVNDLLKDRLIEGQSDDEGRMTIALNDHRLGEVKKVLRPAWAHPGVWVAATLVLVAVAGLLGM